MLFVSLDPASVARLTLACGSEEEFNSLMSALADVPGQVTAPGMAVPPQRGALETVRDYLATVLALEAADRVSSSFETLVRLRRIRVSTQHVDARHRAVTSFAEIGLAFPAAQLGPDLGAHRHPRRQRAGRDTGRSTRQPPPARSRRRRPIETPSRPDQRHAARSATVRTPPSW